MKQCPQCNLSSEDTDIVCRNCGYLFNAFNPSSTPDSGAYQPPPQPQPPQQTQQTQPPYQPYQQDPNYQAQGYPGVQGVPTRKNNGFAVASLVLGIASFVCCGFVTGILAIIFGVISRGKIKASGGAEAGSGMAKAGIILGAIGIVVYIIIIICYIIFYLPTVSSSIAKT